MMDNTKFRFAAIIFSALSTVFLLIAAKPRSSGCRLEIQFGNMVGTKPLTLDSVIYYNEAGQEFVISKFRYYISNIILLKTDGTKFQTNKSFLIDEYESDSKKITLENIPEGEYNTIGFILGVDSLHNCSGAQSGALDPARGMFWAWNTGYVFLKIEGTSPSSQSPGHIFEFHIGGYRQPHNCIRNITLKFLKLPFKINPVLHPAIRIETDVAELFKNPVTIDFSKLSSVTDFHNAVLMADNYSDIFRLKEPQP